MAFLRLYSMAAASIASLVWLVFGWSRTTTSEQFAPLNPRELSTPEPAPGTSDLQTATFTDMKYYKSGWLGIGDKETGSNGEMRLPRLTTHDEFTRYPYRHTEAWTDVWPCLKDVGLDPVYRNTTVRIWAAEVPRMTQDPLPCPVRCNLITGKSPAAAASADAFVIDLARSWRDDVAVYDWKANPLNKVLIGWNIENLEGRRKMLNKAYKHRYLGTAYEVGLWGVFNISISYPMGTDVPLNYYNWAICRDKETNKALTRHRRPVGAKRQPAAAFFASNCGFTSHWRDAVVLELRKRFPVHGFGKCMHSHDITDAGCREGRKGAAKACVYGGYTFTLVIENSVSLDYVTEKVYEPLMAGSIPVYLGAPNVDNYLPTSHSIVKVSDFTSIAALAKYLHCLLANPHLVRHYQSWRHRPAYATWTTFATAYPPLCAACIKIARGEYAANRTPGFIPYVIEENRDGQRPLRECL